MSNKIKLFLYNLFNTVFFLAKSCILSPQHKGTVRTLRLFTFLTTCQLHVVSYCVTGELQHVRVYAYK